MNACLELLFHRLLVVQIISCGEARASSTVVRLGCCDGCGHAARGLCSSDEVRVPLEIREYLACLRPVGDDRVSLAAYYCDSASGRRSVRTDIGQDPSKYCRLWRVLGNRSHADRNRS